MPAGSKGESQVQPDVRQQVWVFNPQLGDFVCLDATRRERDLYELLEAPEGHELQPGDLVRCELSDGELIVHERVWRERMF